MAFKLAQLEYFCTAVEQGSFSAAARFLFTSPQAVSQKISDLEKRMGKQLFFRDGGKAVPTSFAWEFYAKCKEAVALLDSLEKFACETSFDVCDKGRIVVAHDYLPCRGGVIDEEDLCSLESHRRLAIRTTTGDSCRASIERGLSDAAFILGKLDCEGYGCVQLFSLPLVVVVGASNALVKKDWLDVFDFEGLPVAEPWDFGFGYPYVMDYFEKHGVRPRFVDVSASMEGCNWFLEEGGVLLAIPGKALEERYGKMRIMRFCGEYEPLMSVFLLWRRGKADWFASEVRESLLRGEWPQSNKEWIKASTIL